MTKRKFKQQLKAIGAKRRGLRLWVIPEGILGGLGIVEGYSRPFKARIVLKDGQMILWLGCQLAVHVLLRYSNKWQIFRWILGITLWERGAKQWLFFKVRTRPLSDAWPLIQSLRTSVGCKLLGEII